MSTTAWRPWTGRCRRTGRQVGLWRGPVWKGVRFAKNEVRTTGVLSRVWLFVTPWTAACQVSLSMGFSRQEYWSGLLFQGFFLTQGRIYFRGNSLLPTPGFFQESNPCLLYRRQILHHWATWEAQNCVRTWLPQTGMDFTMQSRDFHSGPVVKNPLSNGGDTGSIPVLGLRSYERGKRGYWSLCSWTTTRKPMCHSY